MNNISRLNLISDDPKFIVKPHDVSGERGQDINMTCLVDGNPPPSYTWFKNGNMNYVSSNFYISMIYPLDLLKTKYIKLNTKTQNIFCCVDENLTTFLYTLTGGDKKTIGKKKVFFF